MAVSELPSWVILGSAFVFGATWGSFFNVAIHRWPRDMSVVSPPSHCPACKKPIPGWRNVPILAYVLQRGKAACCGAKMSPRYLFVEVISGALAVAIANRFVVHAERGTTLEAAAMEAALWFVFAGGLVVSTFVDLEWLEIPDEVTIGGTALALATASWRPSVPLEEVVLGAGGAYLAVEILLVWSWERLTRERGMGEGDAKLAMFIGAFLGWRGALFALVAGSFQGIVGYALARATGVKITPPVEIEEDAPGAEHAEAHANENGGSPERGEEHEKSDAGDAAKRWIPFGPFLALGAIEFLFFGGAIVEWYVSLFE
jgi:leader peptidase (prepilin peptidase)/N-methyltransferase